MSNEIPVGYKWTSVGVIPNDWKVISYENIFTFLSTATYSRSQLNNKGDIKYIHYGDIHTKCNHFLDCREFDFPSIPQNTNNRYPIIKEGDLIVVDVSEDYEGLGTSVEIKNVNNKKIISGLHTYLLRDKNELLVNGYKAYIHKINLVKKQIDTLATGLKVYGISKSNLKDILIPIPPSQKEQKAIATALSDVDELIENLQVLIAKKRAIKKGAMQELMKPKDGWNNYRMSELGYNYGGLSSKSKNDFIDGNRPYIPFLNVMNNPIINIKNLEYVKIKSDEKQNEAKKGDLFFNGSSETPKEVGMCSVLLDDVDKLYLNSFCFGLRLYDEFINYGLFLSYFFRSSYGRDLIYSLSQGSTRYNLSKTRFLDIKLSLPLKDEQEKITQILSDMDSEIETLIQKLNKYKMIRKGMMQQLLTGKVRLI